MKIKNIVFITLLATGLVLHASDITVAPGYDWQASQALLAATGSNKITDIEIAIKTGADVNARNILGRTPLHCVASNEVLNTLNALRVVNLLILNGADCNAKDKDGDTPLHFAVIFSASIDVITTLIAKGADVNAQNGIGCTALLLAASHDSPEFFNPRNYHRTNFNPFRVVKLLIENGSNIPTDIPTYLSRAKELLNQVIKEINTERQQKIKDVLQAFKKVREEQLNKKMPLELLNKMANFANPDLLPSATEISKDPAKKALADRIQANIRNQILQERQAKKMRLPSCAKQNCIIASCNELCSML